MASTNKLYEQDYSAWARRQIELLSKRRFADLDIDHLVEELEDMGRSERNELESRLTILLAHLLKWQFQYAALSERWKEFKGDSWRSTIIEQRDRVAKRLQKSPGLRAELAALAAEAYADAIGLASKETGLHPEVFPPDCPYAMEQILDDAFFPESSV
ncbi:hypothetical protein CKO31_07390 [Thiohalocapsa halophila]|uniref:DUF29 domain-containing protein n=1 Tax=Thiohalocapsa halophila TaxID=69359 RepID=A0ABS1CFA1_9GAMM|nr:DUF29 domain-containing protein [Thiohalocapsa halophila]MBK1630570.1 hypothetical protein [Thiohalocapsa halophila]